MASESQTELYISISFPDLDFDTKAVLDTQSDVGPRRTVPHGKQRERSPSHPNS